MEEEEKLQEYLSDIAGEEDGQSETPVEFTLQEAPHPAKRPKAKKYYRGPLYMAAGILVASAGFFGCWKAFFDTSLKNTWHLHYQKSESAEPVDVYITMEDDHRLRLHNGGVTLLETYYEGKDSSDPTFTISITNLEMPYQRISGEFGFSFEGNSFTGKKLLLTDKSGMFMPKDTASSDEEAYRKEHYDRVFRDGAYEYIIPCLEASEEYVIEPIENAVIPEELCGIWLYDAGTSDGSFTYTFTKDGELRMLSEEYDIRGSYTAPDHAIIPRICNISGKVIDADPLTYTLSGDKIVIGSQEMTRVNDPYAFRAEEEASS